MIDVRWFVVDREIELHPTPIEHEPFSPFAQGRLPICRRRRTMKTVIRVSPRDSAKAWALLVRHSRGWPCRTASSLSPTMPYAPCGKPGSASRNCRERPAPRERPPVKEYDFYVPLTYNDGTPIGAKTIERIGQRLLKVGQAFLPDAVGRGSPDHCGEHLRACKKPLKIPGISDSGGLSTNSFGDNWVGSAPR